VSRSGVRVFTTPLAPSTRGSDRATSRTPWHSGVNAEKVISARSSRSLGDPGNAGPDAEPGGSFALDDRIGGVPDGGVNAVAVLVCQFPSYLAGRLRNGQIPAAAPDQCNTALSPCSPSTRASI
jgi:hypothetical protein